MDRLKNPSRGRPRSFSAEADRRQRAFLRGFGIEDAAALKELARRLGRMAPLASPQQIEAAAGLWFADLFGWPENAAGKALAAGRVAWLGARIGRRWPLALFADAPPAALVETLRRARPALPPPILADAMPEAELVTRRLRGFVPKPLGARAA